VDVIKALYFLLVFAMSPDGTDPQSLVIPVETQEDCVMIGKEVVRQIEADGTMDAWFICIEKVIPPEV
jgi:hypothetical protein